MKINPTIFREYDIRGKYPSELSNETAQLLGRAFIKDKKIKTLVLGRDKRLESKKVADNFSRGALAGGAKIMDLGVVSTPILFWSVNELKADGGAMVTPSHIPLGYAGIKLCGRDGLTLGLRTGLKKLKTLAEEIPDHQSAERGTSKIIKKIDPVNDYRDFILTFVKGRKIKKFKIVLDASGGSGAGMAEKVFAALPVQIIKMNFQPRDRYPDHGLNPLLASNYRSIAKVVKGKKADLGLIWDGDADRLIFIDEQGKFIPPYYLNCLLAKIFLEKYPQSGLVVDARLNLGIGEIIKAGGGRALVCRSGYTNLVKLMLGKRSLFGCENSGHYLFNLLLKKQKNYVWGESILPALLVLEYLSAHNLSLSQALKPIISKYFISGEINLPLKNYGAAKQKIKKHFGENILSELDGLSVKDNQGAWFFNIRPSKNEPLVRLNVEAKNRTKLASLKAELLKLIKSV